MSKKKINEYDYLSISTRVHVLENRLLTKERLERMLDARSVEEAAKVPVECGYPEFDDLSPGGIEKTLSAMRADTVADLRKQCPDPAIVDVFSLQYDYHNAKALVKAAPLGEDPAPLLIDAGRYPAKDLAEDFDRGDRLPGTKTFVNAVGEAKAVLANTGDPQKADMVLDRAYYAELAQAAQDSRSAFLQGYVALSIDLANLRSTVRAMRMGRDGSFLKEVLVPGGGTSAERFLAAAGSGDLTAAASGPLTAAAQAGNAALEGGPLTAFEKACDDTLTAYLGKAKSVPFGEQPLIGYLYARQSEATAIRIILTGLQAGLDTDTIRERLRESYV